MPVPGPALTLTAGVLLAGSLLVAASMAAGGGADDSAAAGATATASATASPDATGSATAGGGASADPAGAGDASEDADTEATYAGRVDVNEGALSVVVKGDLAVGYFCDGVHEAWLSGQAQDGEVLMVSKDGSSLSAEVDDGRLAGEIDTDAGSWTFSIAAAEAPSGPYRATAQVRGATVVAGWVVLPDGNQVGLVTTDGEAAEAPALDTADASAVIDGTDVTAAPLEP